jgi:hypothetical protein
MVIVNVKFTKFDLDSSIVAPCIYGQAQHQVTEVGVVLSAAVRTELHRFLKDYTEFSQFGGTPYYRIDAYFTPDKLSILEVNAAFVDGWGTALNLSRAAGRLVTHPKLRFPVRLATEDPVYEPELKLLQQELAEVGHPPVSLVPFVPDAAMRLIDPPMYVYGRVGQSTQPWLLPFNGVYADNKLHLAAFSDRWQSRLVQVPKMYAAPETPWEQVPETVAIKFASKDSPECQQARTSLWLGKPAGKAPFIRRCYAERLVVAQDLVAPTQYEGANCQLIILAVGDQPITGYVQFSSKLIINDNSVHGPLLFE